MRDLGYVEGQNVVFERRWAEGRNERFPTLVAELVALNPDVIVSDSTPAALAARQATASVPIVMINVSDPVGSGLIASLARPGGNVTGPTDFGTETAEKAVDILHTVAPRATRIAVLLSDNPVHPAQLRVIQDAARKIGLAVLPYGSSAQYRWQLTAPFVAKILKGARPSELPVQQPAEVELWINLKTAKALGLTISPSLLQRADQVIE